ncbi:putative dihydrolipoamide acetyltransferase component of pyruvate dehydrogenase complex [Lyophyllum shimeji]|uniref:Dihydrolipoamide acetyltransferase component of pyruvate dehydrogenase complex n=1 Tax=Lyophyllum shimeji TaxID=47721 RepID=A0A9P3UMZ3_LYOSH|nr:putative dihydrolipoamide acetyltransferase component of pyruvate dehydrogenase complex [Lyophyllum shimeji]
MLVRPLRRLLGRPSVVSYFHTTAIPWASRKVVQKFKLADIGEGITECEVIKWSVQPLAKIQAFDALCEVQSDKASVEITSPFDGVVKELLVQEGEVAKVGSGLCLIEVDEEAVEGADPAAVEPVDRAPPPPPPPATPQEPPTPLGPPPVTATETKPKPEPPRRLHPMDPNFTPPPAPAGGEKDKDVLAAPSVRHFARQHNVDLARLVPGSGKGGRIEKRDVEAYLARPAQPEAPAAQAQQPVGQDVVVELGRTRYNMWKAMVKSLEIPHFGYSTTLDITALHNLLPTLNAHIPAHFLPAPPKPPLLTVNPSAIYPAPSPARVPEPQQYTKLTYLPVLLKMLSKAMLDWPLFRSSITPASQEGGKPTLTVRPHADISIALSTPTGLYSPTLQAADTSSIYGLTARLKHLSHLGRQTPCALGPGELPKRGGTITVSNVGAIGAAEYAHPVLVPGGGVAIVALGRARWVWDVESGDGKGERRLKMGVSWSADHRVVEGAELAAFVECWRGYVERPERLIGEAV